MSDWTGGVALFLAIIVVLLYHLLRDKKPHSFNPRPYIEEERKDWMEFESSTFIPFVSALAVIFLLNQFARWAWRRW